MQTALLNQFNSATARPEKVMEGKARLGGGSRGSGSQRFGAHKFAAL